MRKLFVAALVMLLSVSALSAQNNFRGIVRYQVTSSGKVDSQVPAEQAVVEMKVFDNKLSLGQTLQTDMKVAQAIDYSPALQYLAMNDIELESYTGDAKFLIRGEITKEEADSIYLEDKEPGHFYYEMVDETTDILGYQAKKLIMHRYDEEGVDNPAICWYTTEIGPEYCLLFGNIKGFPLVLSQDLGEGKAITYTAVEIIKGKVKEVDMMVPYGYKETTQEEFVAFMKELQEAAELLEE